MDLRAPAPSCNTWVRNLGRLVWVASAPQICWIMDYRVSWKWVAFIRMQGSIVEIHMLISKSYRFDFVYLHLENKDP